MFYRERTFKEIVNSESDCLGCASNQINRDNILFPHSHFSPFRGWLLGMIFVQSSFLMSFTIVPIPFLICCRRDSSV
jgi:hypothetical protein